MNPINRLDKYKSESFDTVMIMIKNLNLKCGKYSHLVKMDKDSSIKLKRMELFNDEDSTG